MTSSKKMNLKYALVASNSQSSRYCIVTCTACALTKEIQHSASYDSTRNVKWHGIAAVQPHIDSTVQGSPVRRSRARSPKCVCASSTLADPSKKYNPNPQLCKACRVCEAINLPCDEVQQLGTTFGVGSNLHYFQECLIPPKVPKM